MKKIEICSAVCALTCLSLVTSLMISVEGQSCIPSGEILGTEPPSGQCSRNCCQQGKHYLTYECSPPVSSSTMATLTINSFEQGGDGGAPSQCDSQYHSDGTLVVALSTGWFNNESRCMKYINIFGNGNSVQAQVVDQCDSTLGCDADHGYQPPCTNNIVDASRAVWEALGVSRDQWGLMDISWSDV